MRSLSFIVLSVFAALFGFMSCAASADYKCDASGRDAFFSDADIRSYQAGKDIPLYKSQIGSDGLNEISAIGRGAYFIAAPQKNGLYCAVYFSGTGDETVSVIGLIKSKNFQETKISEYDELLNKWWGASDGDTEAAQLEFLPERGGIVATARQQDCGDSDSCDAMAGMTLKISPSSFIILSSQRPYYILSKSGELFMETAYPVSQEAGSDGLKGQYFANAYFAKADDDCGIMDKFNDALSYRAGGKILFYKTCPQGLCPTGGYIIKGDYFIAVPRKDGTYCAAYLSETTGEAKSIGVIEDKNFTPTANSEYSELLGRWISSDAFEFADIYPGEDGDGVFISSSAGAAEFMDDSVGLDRHKAILKIRPSIFAARTWAGDTPTIITADAKSGKMKIAVGKSVPSIYSPITPDCSRADDVLINIPALDIKHMLAGEETRSYMADGKVPFYKSCAQGLCPTGVYIIKGDYFLAAKRRDGSYCAVYMKENGSKVTPIIGLVKAGNFAETASSEYKSLFKTWQSFIGAPGSSGEIKRKIIFSDDAAAGRIASEEQFWMLINDDRDAPYSDDARYGLPPSDYYPKKYHWHQEDLDDAFGTVLKVAPSSFLISEKWEMYYVRLSSGKLVFGRGNREGRSYSPVDETH